MFVCCLFVVCCGICFLSFSRYVSRVVVVVVVVVDDVEVVVVTVVVVAAAVVDWDVVIVVGAVHGG